ncbi:Protein kinase superfamily protein [Arabidopsis thaliana]|uniref:LEAF RUST 10 DISEASE-RESISTANCE LOCUS RECEPTOR-LIKE PROTEIN KINASE-like 2.5 n=1 Tax=Arabidopsis thaliana TaxID=3702 RepID=LRL25_ARATH|nr:Protein kinase superfamily protein [Arabidopsis thaliana]F4HQ20.1 RecName: Full=LEAF RUST 10 DISEASE-RESISTANCE LOCUS RECEPTOR-LIKE PROTEIN KINASE-like 2.5; AltName: Full=Probable receptor-like serine/threonine-protein kinase LRK10L-2.5; Flags: Precursor [Arabidopsis thaliana]AEE34570.1 Protein kinase superfamily protein [Arabidopsis thaliana]|eukprot:NP_176863.2 Protein kinase superfamily protein [Arabidopsis thaliana]
MINFSLSLTKSMSYSFIWMLFVIHISCVLSADGNHILCSPSFTCGNQRGLLYPFWIAGRKECGHPDFELDCNAGVPELSISSVKFRILGADYDSGIITLARSDNIDDPCLPNSFTTSFNETVLPLASTTDLLTIYYDCNRNVSSFVSTFVKELDCPDDGTDDRRNYYLTRNLTFLPPSLKLEGNSFLLNDFGGSCSRNVSNPASRTALNTLESTPSTDNLKIALEDGFALEVNSDCRTCIDSKGACGFSQTSSRFVCYYRQEPQNPTRNKVILKLFFIVIYVLGIGAASFAMMGVILVVTCLNCLIRRQRKTLNDPRMRTSDDSRQQNLKALIPLKHYSYAQVTSITKSFAEVIGKGGFGTVYRGTLYDGRSVAVKVLKESQGNGEDFINEVASMSQTSHVNIVTLLGFCSEGYKRAIIYEFMENGSLDKFISSKKSSTMDWRELYGIALGVARGLEYLHHGCRTRIVHFDIKPQNVLLDDNLSPKVSDFGLAKLCERKESILSLMDTRGTIGYIAPEVFSRVYGRVSHKSDVYSYGMLVLDIIGARNKTSTEDTTSSTSSMYFPEWIYRDLEKAHNGKSIETAISNEEDEIAKKMTLVGLWCIQPWPLDRPAMNRVVEMMEGNLDALEVPPRPVLQQIPTATLQESSTFSEDISAYTEICSINVA